MAGVFDHLNSQAGFVSAVKKFFGQIPEEIAPILECEVELEEARIVYAFKAYTQGVDKFALLLNSKDPDHFKRAGALLHSLYVSKVIGNVSYGVDADEVEAGMGPVNVHVGDIQYSLKFKSFYDEYHNEVMAFFMAYAYCAAYEQNAKSYDFDYLQTVCVYLKNNSSLSVESFFILFKSLMHG